MATDMLPMAVFVQRAESSEQRREDRGHGGASREQGAGRREGEKERERAGSREQGTASSELRAASGAASRA